ncbi:AraC family transcriptional regulator [Actinosynnema pretiosum]|uniref:AraC family transcriptional regulator n=2 Tax=Actinosynnema TaxID=40566 RepID=UPI001E5BEB23|nr:AraC family transcriptional regulator [Actinosynnema pretiosum]
MDVVSDVVEVARCGRAVHGRAGFDGPWRFRFSTCRGVGFHVLLRGSGWLVPERGEPLPLGVGDVVLAPRLGGHVLSDLPVSEGAVPFSAVGASRGSGEGGAVDLLCGEYPLDGSRSHPLLEALPEVVHLPARVGGHRDLRAAVDLLGREVRAGRSGRDALVSGLLDLVLVYSLRAWLEDNPDGGWARALRDEGVASVLDALHTSPAEQWRIEVLADRAGMSRATLARRFTALTGRSPMAYLAWWRMVLASKLLKETELPLHGVAQRVGYSSPFAFSHAFKRYNGVAPAHYRSAAADLR